MREKSRKRGTPEQRELRYFGSCLRGWTEEGDHVTHFSDKGAELPRRNCDFFLFLFKVDPRTAAHVRLDTW